MFNMRFISRYLVMIPFYAAAIVFAVLVGATGHIVPTQSEWFRVDFPIETFLIALDIYFVTLPLFILLVLNIMWFGQQFCRLRYSVSELVTKTIVAVAIAFPTVGIAFHLYIASSLMWNLYEVILAYFVIFWVVILIYLLGITGLASKEVRYHVISCLDSPRFWSSFVLVSVILLLPTSALIFPLLKGYFWYFPTIELFWRRLPDLIARATMIAMVLPALPVVFLRLETD
ncbi:MAG: hypothetical protein RTU30_12535 [Candidatus Thorarchaeota archaeon]